MRHQNLLITEQIV